MPEFSRQIESPEHEPTPEPLESRLNLRTQYEERIRALNQTGVLELLPEKSALGIVGLNGKEYPMPEYEKLLEVLRANEHRLKEKREQGFDQLLLVPMAIPFYVLDEYKQADIKSTLLYHPRSFSREHGGQTKQELISSSKDSAFPGWKIILMPDTDIPRAGQGQTTGGRKELEAGQSPEEYLKLLQTNPEYSQEEGFTPEDWLVYALTILEERNEVIDDWQNQGSVSYLIGAYFPASGSVPYADWFRDRRQAYLGRYNPGNRYEVFGARVGVRVEKGFGNSYFY